MGPLEMADNKRVTVFVHPYKIYKCSCNLVGAHLAQVHQQETNSVDMGITIPQSDKIHEHHHLW